MLSKNKERVPKEARERYQNLSKEEKNAKKRPVKGLKNFPALNALFNAPL